MAGVKNAVPWAELSDQIKLLRQETRADIKNLHEKLDSKFDTLSKEFASTKIDVAVQKTKIGAFSALISLSVAAVISWFVSHIKMN